MKRKAVHQWYHLCPNEKDASHQ